MKFKKITFLSLLAASSIALSGCYIDLGFMRIGTPPENTQDVDHPVIDTDKIAKYYSSISSNLSGTNLLSSLRSLNTSKRTKTAGYGAMGTTASGLFKYTDYDPSTVKYSSSGIAYGTKILSFYTGKPLPSSGNTREHVWPASRLPGGRDGNIVDDDIYMPRPESDGNNGTRSNLVYGEGTGCYDPVAEFGVNGVYQGIRGECARIIFYCMLVDDRLQLNNSTANSGNNMGKLDDLVKWSCQNPVNDREIRRQAGGEYLQGNRNAFVDHPEYVCKIWGNSSSATRSACSSAGYSVN